MADLDQRIVKKRAPKNVGKKANYYTFPAGSGSAKEDIEHALSQIESATAPVVRELLAGNLNLAEQDRANLLFFLAFFVTRVPHFRNRVEEFLGNVGRKMLMMSARHPEYFERTLREAHKGKKEFTAEEVEELRQWTLDESNYSVRGSPNASLGMGIRVTMETVFPIFNDMKWSFLRSSHPHYFLTSDSPVSRIDPTMPNSIYAYGLANKYIEVTFPLGPELCLLGTWEGRTGAVHVPAKVVEQINRRTAIFADKHIFANRRELAEEILAMGRNTGKRPPAVTQARQSNMKANRGS